MCIRDRDWVYEEFKDTSNYQYIGFGTAESKMGGYIWGLTVTQPDKIQKMIAQTGSQFEDRKEVKSSLVIGESIPAQMVTVTTNKYPDWISKTIYFEHKGKLYVIGNGAVQDDRFATFYNSFEFSN